MQAETKPATAWRKALSWAWLWARAARAPFLTASLVSVALGAAVARWDGHVLELPALAVTVLGVAAVHAAVNLANDYFDHRLGTDGINRYRSPFNGGAGLIQAGLIAPRAVLIAADVCLVVAAACGVALALQRGTVVWALMAAGFVLGIGYSADPLQLMRTGWGEAVAGLCCGPLVAFGTYFVLAGRGSLSVVWPSLPVGLLVSAILVINEVPDYEADRQARKANLVVRNGPQAGVKLHRWLMGATYGLVALLPLLGRIPWGALIALATVPAARRALKLARTYAADPVRIIPANAGTVLLHAAVGLLITCSYLVYPPR